MVKWKNVPIVSGCTGCVETEEMKKARRATERYAKKYPKRYALEQRITELENRLNAAIRALNGDYDDYC